MSLLAQPAPDSPSPSGVALWRSPWVLALYLPGFAVALLCGWSLTTRLKSGHESTSMKAAIGGGGLPLLHAQEEFHWVRQQEAASQNQDFTRLTHVVTDLKAQLAAVDSQITDSQKKLAEMEANAGSAEARKNAYLAEKQRLEQVLAAFAKADAERQTAEQTAMSALPTGAVSLSAKDLDSWKTEWQAMAADADTKIKTARKSVLELQQLKAEWESGQETFSAAQKTEMQGRLLTLQGTTESSLKAARDAVAASEKPLKDKIQAQGEQLAQVIKSAEK